MVWQIEYLIKMTRLETGLNVGDRASGMGLNIKAMNINYLAFCLQKDKLMQQQ